MAANFDDIYKHAGPLGRFQLSRYIVLSLGIMSAAMQILQLSFTGAVPAHRCLTECDGDNPEYITPWLSGAVPYQDGKPSQCDMYTEPVCRNNTEPSSKETENCQQMVYDHTYYTETSVTEFDLVCDKSYLVPLTSSILMSGELFGSIIFGSLSDRIGRRRAWALAALTCGIMSICTSVIPSLPVHIIFVCFCSMGGIALHLLSHVIVMETVGNKYRILMGVANQISFSIGETLLGIIALGVKKWRSLQFLLSLPFFVIAPVFFWIMPESPRWLLLQGRWQESQDVIKKIAKGNGKSVPEKILPYEDSVPKAEENQDRSVKAILTRPKLRNITLVIFFNWFVNAMLYYGLSFNASNVKGIDPYVIHYITMLAEIPGNLLSLLLINRLGRKKLTVLYYLVAGVACFVAGGLYDLNVWASVALSLVGKACVAGNFGIAFIYAGEIYPTYIRGSAMGAASMSARPGGIIAPYIAYLGDIRLIIPLAIFGGFGIAAGILTFIFLPETLGKPLPENLEQAENFDRSQGVNVESAVEEKDNVS